MAQLNSYIFVVVQRFDKKIMLTKSEQSGTSEVAHALDTIKYRYFLLDDIKKVRVPSGQAKAFCSSHLRDCLDPIVGVLGDR